MKFIIVKLAAVLRLVILFGFYIITGLYLLEFFQYQISFDGTAMISIARAFKELDLHSAINAQWGAFYSLLLAPFLFIEKPHVMFSVKLYQLLTGAFGLYGFYRLLKLFNLNIFVELLTLLVSVPIFLYFVFYSTSVDLLFATIMLFYLAIIFSPQYPQKLKNGLWCGILGGLLFLTKEYAFYYFLAHFAFFSFLQWLSAKNNVWKKNILKQFSLGLMIFFMIVLVWSSLLFWKYGRFMIGVRGEVNLGLINPNFQEYPMFTDGLFRPPNSLGFTVWDDPTYLTFKTWNPFENETNIKYMANHIIKNMQLIASFLDGYSILFLPILFISALWIIFNRRTIIFENNILWYSVATILSFPVGYLILLVESRYLWIIYILGLSVTAFLVSKFIESGFIKSKKNFYLAGIVIGGILIASLAITPIKYLKNYHYIDHTYFDQGKILTSLRIFNSKVASNSDYHHSAYVLFYSGNQYLGIPKDTLDFKEYDKQLKQFNVDYLLVWDDNKFLSDFRKKYIQIKTPDIGNLSIIKLKINSFSSKH